MGTATEYPSRRGIYYIEERPSGLFIWVRLRPAGDTRKRKYGRRLDKYFADLGLSIVRHMNDRNCMRVVDVIRNEIDAPADEANVRESTELLRAIEDYVEHLRASGRSRQHVSTIRYRMRASIGHGRNRRDVFLPWKTTADITRKSFRKYMADRSREKSASDANHALAAWRAFCSWQVSNDEMTANPLVGISAIRQPVERQRVLTPEELERLLEACRRGPSTAVVNGRKRRVNGAPAWLEPAVTILAYTGMRPCELARLTWEDSIDLEQRRITVRRKGNRIWSIPMAARVKALLDAVPKRDRGGPVVPGFPYNEEHDTPVKYSLVIRRAAKEAGLEGVTLYTLRRSVATHLAQAGESVSRLQAFMGWTSPAMAARYVNLAAMDIQDMVEELPWK